MIQIFDDGSTIETDSSGAVVRVTDANGSTVQPDTSIFGDFAREVIGGASGAVRDYLRGRSSAPSTTAAPAVRAAGMPAWLLPAALALGAWLLIKKSSG